MTLTSREPDLKPRTKQFALRVIRLFRSLPRKPEAEVIGKQLLRSATSVGANYRVVCRSRSDAEFLAKIGIVLEEADESVFWIELLAESGLVPAKRIADLLQEAQELVAIFAQSRITAQRRNKTKP